MTLLVYSGPHPEAVIEDLLSGAVIDVVAGRPVDVPAALAERLLEQDTWALAEAPSKSKKVDS